MANIFDVMDTALKEAGKTIRLNKRFSEIMFITFIFSLMFCFFGYIIFSEISTSMKDMTKAINEQSKAFNSFAQRQISMGGR